MRRNLPPLKSLVALESVIRHKSVTKAADELFVTHGAISKHIASVEDWIGLPLFAKKRRSMQPTEAALKLAEAANKAWTLIADSVDAARAEEEPTVLNVVCPATFSMRWLIPRVWDFSAKHPRISVLIRQTHTGDKWLETPFDVAIRSAGPIPARYASNCFLREELALLVSPRAVSKPGAMIADMHGIKLLRAMTRPGELEAWLKAAGAPGGAVASAQAFPHFYIALEAALAGAGALICPLETVRDLLERGDLIEPWPRIRIPGPDHEAIYDPGTAQARAAETFSDWLIGVAREAARATAS
ncbi:LysR substrate-binding domain-containing protein [Microvirga brassicacearum]|uniref:LysR family transcriptional regulator n=1 Tax=Microvirga brassicacearum TaxID=2580413 RepID=A0A5N3PEE5_9HYPH|nr:LysR substrate-binding domain-containing protein [Microvirga brassicacearum]KAB0268015.1 LysR family transcriptional regulator [Microvirga brassicacearum]